MKKRLLACLLTAAMLVSLFPLPALAAEAERPEWTVTAFDPLDGDIAAQTVPQGGEPVLPDSLTAWAYVIEDDTAVIPPPEGLEQESEQPQTDGPEEAEDNQLPVDGQEGPGDEQLPSDNAGEPSTPDVTLVSRTAENTPEPAEKQEPNIQPVTIPGVTWEAQPEFDLDAPGEYVYTPVLPASYEVAGEVELPVISVTVTAAEQTVLQRVQAMIDALPAPEDITAENRDEVEAQLEAIGEAWAELSEEDAPRLDTARLEAAWNALAALDGQAGNELPAPLADTVNGVNYLDANGNQQTADNVKVVDSTTTTWGSGWYVVNGTVSIDSRINTGSDVRLILADGCQLIASEGINVNANQSLTIYGQDGTNGAIGKLSATGGHSYAGIGSGKGSNSGTITINGGDINAVGGYCAAGIGGGGDWNGDNNNPGGDVVGAITINGGIVKAEGVIGAGIGGGNMKSSNTVLITGGVVTAISSMGMGIGGGRYGGSGSFSTGENGKAVILASAGNPIGDRSEQEKWRGIIFLGTEGKVYGDQTLSTDVTVSYGGKLTIPQGTKLTISPSGKLTNNGTVENNGTIHNEGTITGDIRFEGTGTITGTKPSMPEVSYLAWNGSEQNWENGTRSDYIPVNTGTISWGVATQERWYVVSGDVTVSSQITVTGDVHLILTDNCVLTVENGISVNGGNSLTIYAQSTGEDMGRLTATHKTGYCAGIGSAEGFSGGAITIYGGSITANGGSSGAGIGGGRGGDGGAITIYGGSITANGGSSGAGIGGGNNGDGGVITIYGGSITANGSSSGAGIGGGNWGDGGVIAIYGGSITANGSGGAGIGGGNNGDGDAITISGGTVKAVSSENGAGIGGGSTRNGGTILIRGESTHVTATSANGAGIGGGKGYESKGGSGGTITIEGGTVIATGGSAGIGGGNGGINTTGQMQDEKLMDGGSGGTITITGGTVTATGSGGAADVGGGYGKSGVADTDKIEINPGITVKNSSGGDADIGPAHGPDTSKWATDGTHHWHPCKLDGCTTHQYEQGSHNVDTQTWVWDNDQHWHGCTICGAALQNVEGHNWIGLTCSTCQAARAAAPNVTINYAAETLSTTTAMEYSTDNGSNWRTCRENMSPRYFDWYGDGPTTVQFRTKATDSACASEAQEVTIPARPGEPIGLQAVGATSAGNDGRITGVDETMEYRKYGDGEETWMPCTGGEITGLTAGEYIVRHKATGTDFASYKAYVAVRAAAPERGFCLNDGDIDISDDGNGGIMVRQNGTEYTVSNGEVLITGKEESTPNTIAVNNVTAHITLSNVQQNSNRNCPLDIWRANVRLTLEGNNTVLTRNSAIYAGTYSSLTIEGPGTLTIGSADQRVSQGIYISDTNVTIDGGVLNIYAQNAAIIGWYDGDSLTVNGGVIRGDVSGGDRGYSGLGVSGNSSGDSMDITINGGTVELTGSNNKIYADSGTVVITGGSVTAGGVTPAPTNRTDPVYAVTVEGIGSGTVDALLLKKGDAVQAYGAPACTTTDGKVILYLPEGTYSGTAIVGGKLVNFTCEAKADGTETTTATDTGVTITTPEGEKPTIDEDGGVTVPDGSTVQTGDGPEITVGGQGGTVDGDGGITVPGGGNVTVKGDSDDTTITLPSGGGTVKPNPDGTIPLPGGSTVQTGENGPEITVGDKGGTVDGGGGITVPDGGTVQTGNPATTITPPNGGKVNPKEDGTVEVPEGTTVKPGDGGSEIIVGPGNSGTISGDGGVTVEGGGKVTVKDDSGDITITLPSGGGTVKPKPDGTIPLPGGAKVEQGGQEITVPDGGGTYHPEDGTVTKDVCTVTFDSQGGSAVSPIIVTLGEKATKPGNPTKSGYTFDGWYKESGCTTAWNFDTDTVTGNITLYAKWTQNSNGGGGGGTYTPTYPPTVEKPSEGGGTPTVTPSNPKQGDTVTVTPKPDTGYEVDTITVTDRNGKPVEVTKKPDGTYTFKQPSGKVTIKVTYQPIDRPWNNPFADVSKDDWYYEAVRFVQERGLMNGYSDGRFGPNDTLSRAQLAQILFNKEGRPGVNYLMDFSDVAGEAWYTEAIRWATSQGIVGGYGNGTFGPNDPITREQLAVMLWRYSGSPAATNKELHFNDESEISGFALEALRWAVENGILNGYGDGRLGPQGQATRAQAAQMLKNFIENQEDNT